MTDNANEKSARAKQNRVQSFLDCIAYLMAKHWLRNQRQQKVMLLQNNQEPLPKQIGS